MQNDKTNELGLRDKVVVGTGATSGFGRGAAIKFAKAGAAVAVAARRYHLRGRAAHTDVSKPEDVERLYRATIAEFGRLDAWVNDAGVGALGPFVNVPLVDHEQVVRTNLLGTL